MVFAQLGGRLVGYLIQGINFCGFIDESNRDQNLETLRALRTALLRKWPDVELEASADLLDIVKGG